METLHSRLVQYRPIFLDHKTRVERTGGGDALLNAQLKVVENHMNDLLDAYQIELVQLETGAQPIQPRQVENFGLVGSPLVEPRLLDGLGNE